MSNSAEAIRRRGKMGENEIGGFISYLAVVIPIPTSLCGGPFSSELLLGGNYGGGGGPLASRLCVSHWNYYLELGKVAICFFCIVLIVVGDIIDLELYLLRDLIGGGPYFPQPL